MNRLTANAFPLFRVAGIQVYLHWSWLAVAFFEFANRGSRYQSAAWNVVEYLALFGIVLLHEFGHAFACRSVGGQAERIVLWPLGGIAFAQPPPRPGALLWTIAAGPLVNVVLVPVTIVAAIAAGRAGLGMTHPDFAQFLNTIAVINFVLLVFNLLPIYPMDGGQILQALLWFVMGQARSLVVAGIIGLIGAAGAVVLALTRINDWWLAAMALFIAWQAWNGFRLGLRMHGLQGTLKVLNQGLTALNVGNHDEAVAQFTSVIHAGPKEPALLAAALASRSAAEIQRGNWQQAIEDGRGALRVQPNNAAAQNNLAWLLSTCPVDALRDGKEAVALATLACNATGFANATFLATLAAACAEVGDYHQAVRLQEKALADPAYRSAYGEAGANERLGLYQAGVPWRLSPQQG